jgi:hypothetical protein
MIRSMVQSALCLVLCPPLVAQQATQTPPPSIAQQPPQPALATTNAKPVQPESIAIPEDTKIVLELKEQVALASPSSGSAIQLVVVRDVVVNGITALQAGTSVAGVFADQRHGAHKLHRDGSVSIRARELQTGSPIKVRLPGKQRGAPSTQGPRVFSVNPRVIPIVVLGLVLLALVAAT